MIDTQAIRINLLDAAIHGNLTENNDYPSAETILSSIEEQYSALLSSCDTKEIVALLVNNRGAMTTNGEIIASLWEDDGDPEKKASYLSNLRQDLTNTFARLKISNLLLKQRGALAIAADRIECDVYDWLKNKQKSKYNYLGDYMNQYSWAEYIHAELDEISYAMDD